MAGISFLSEEASFKLKDKLLLKRWLKAIAEKEKKSIQNLHYIFCNDERVFSINKEFLKHSTLTDIITFDYCEKNKISGEIYISVDRVNENARKFDVTTQHETLRVMAHGLLHLMGYKDKSEKDIKGMRKKEDAAIELFLKGNINR